MNNCILHIHQSATHETTESFVSFKKFTEFLRDKIQKGQGTRSRFYKYVLDKFEASPELLVNIATKGIEKYDELLELVLSIVMPLAEDEDEVLMGFANALSTEVFYCTSAFFTLLEPTCTGKVIAPAGSKDAAWQVLKELQYSFILNQLYGINSVQRKEWIQRSVDPDTGLYKYYRLNIDSRFVEVSAKGDLPRIDPVIIQSELTSGNGFTRLSKLMPLDAFNSTGFTIITLTDVTTEQTVEQIGKVVATIGDEKKASSFEEIILLLQTLIGDRRYNFGIMPFFTINDRAAILYENFPYSILVNACWNAQVSKKDLTTFINHFLQLPAVITFDATIFDNEFPIVIENALQHAGITFYKLVPVYFNSRLVGLFETAAKSDVAVPNTYQLTQVQRATPYIAQLLRVYIDKFNMAVDAIVKDKFTNIQPAVQWKFNEVAWHHLRNNAIEHKDVAIETVAFKNVYPLYGAVDMRNSTIERNKVVRQDLMQHVTLLTEIFAMLKDDTEAARILDICAHWEHHLGHYIIIEELQLEHFIKHEVQPYLTSLENPPLAAAVKIAEYRIGLDERTGIVFKKRRQLESSVQLINNYLGQHFDKFKEELQLLYPCYFEKFRTDGIEYDIYIGQSIAPKIPFSKQHLQRLRLSQVRSMADIAKFTWSLLPQMQYPLQTTQLLYVNAHTIDITFRNDERRFDVEGTYNIRYHVVKKRIDKVHILNSGGRLTQPQKIAIVYFDEKDASEYAGYINQLQQQNVLLNDLEYLELEELQGVAGLKALRVGVAVP